MENKLQGKRLLVLGGSIWKEAIKEYADQNGIVLISAGLYPAGTDDIAQEVYRIDTTDSNLMKLFIKEHYIDGVYMGGSELIISAACQYINELGLPCYCTKEQWEFLQNKRNFKELCVKYGLPVAPRYQIDENDIKGSLPCGVYPVITKPEDGSGSNGFSVCHSPEDLERGYANASANSPTGSVICEKYVKNDSVVVFYTFSNGDLHFSGLEDKISVKFRKQGTYVGGLFIFESNYTQEFRNRFEAKLKLLFNSIGIREGSAWIEVFHDGDNYYFNEVGFRYGGSVSVYPVDYMYGYNQVAADIHYALTGISKIDGHPSLISKDIPKKHHYAIYPIYLWPGRIAQISGVREIEKRSEVVFCSLTKKIGSEVPDSGSFNQCFALVHFVYDTIEECGDMLRFIHQTLSVASESGKDIVFKMLDFDTIEMEEFEKSLHCQSITGNEKLTDWFRRRMMDTHVYGGASFKKQLEETLDIFCKGKSNDISFIECITDDIIECFVKFRIRPSDYFLFGFNTVNTSNESRASFVTDRDKDTILIEEDGWDNYLELSDKYAFYRKAEMFYGRKLFLFDANTEKESAIQFMLEVQDLFIKPQGGSYGNGAFVSKCNNEEQANKLFGKLIDKGGTWIIEEHIIQDEGMAKWNPSSVNTIRFTSMLTHKGYHCLTPVLRTGRKGNIVDNGGSGGILADIDLETGRIYTDGIDERCQVYKCHPDSGITFQGSEIPNWELLKETVKRAHETVASNHKYIGWDLALSKGKWIVIEGNWGQFLNQYVDKVGRKKEFLEYIKA